MAKSAPFRHWCREISSHIGNKLSKITTPGSAFLLGVLLSLLYQQIHEIITVSVTIPITRSQSAINGLSADSYDMTIITGYYDIGTFRKKQSWRRRTKALYHEWMEQWSFVDNKVIAFFDDPDSADVFRKARGQQPTEIHLVNRYSLTSFKQLPQVRKILSAPNYVKLHPETTVPEYSCVNNLKYDLVHLALTNANFSSTYYAWLDIGTFNYHVNRLHRSFTVSLPDNADVSKVMYVQADPFRNITVKEAFTKRKRWLGAGAFLGTKDNLLFIVEKYMEAVQFYLDRNLVCNDQAMLYGLTLGKEYGGLDLSDRIQALPTLKWHDRGYEVVYQFQTTARYPLKMCTEQIEEGLRRSCLGLGL